MLDYIRIGCAVPAVQVADTVRNTRDICNYIAKADEAACDLVVFPELAVTGYTCADLFFQENLLKATVLGLKEIATYSAGHPAVTAVVGAPVVICGQMYNCGVVISGGVIRGIVPKTYLPNYKEFYERRWFSSSQDLHCKELSSRDLGLEEAYSIPVGRDLLFTLGDGTILGVEICEDLWTPMPPSTMLTINGAEVVVNLSASNETVGKREVRRDLVRHQSNICNCIYAYVSSGHTESTQDLVFGGHSMVCENGTLLAENSSLIETDYMLVQEADLGKVRSVRRKNKSVRDAASFYGNYEPMRTVPCTGGSLRGDGTSYSLSKLPFVPENPVKRTERCLSAFEIQVMGLMQRIKTLNAKVVIGVSGGLDSTLALLVAAETVRRLGRPATDVYAVTMPGSGTSGRTYGNAMALTKELGVSVKEISIKSAMEQHFRDIGHDPNVFNGTYENAQARERTQILMDYASVVGGIVIGTGDLSELALGWCTYNGDHMSMYGVNASIPKTMIPWIIRTVAQLDAYKGTAAVLEDILATPISPELLPPDESGNITQHTEDLVGPYALHDFFLYHMLRFDFAPTKIYTLTCRAFAGEYSDETIKKWLKAFYRRFFAQQFKRSCMPEGVKVGNISLSPRGDWRMPSDASARIWLEEVEAL